MESCLSQALDSSQVDEWDPNSPAGGLDKPNVRRVQRVRRTEKRDGGPLGSPANGQPQMGQQMGVNIDP